MSRSNKQRHGHKAHRSRTAAQRTQQLIEDTVATFTCAADLTHDFVHQCLDELENLDCDIDYNQLALQMWGGRPGRVADLVAVLEDYLAARQQYRAVLATLHQRLTALCTAPPDEHLDPQQWRDVVSARVRGVSPAS